VREVVSCTVTCDDLGVTLSDWTGDREIQARLRWDEVGAVLAYKRDCLMVDQIRVILVDRSGVVRVDMSEEDAGYRILIDELPRRLVGCLTPDEWFQRVAMPAFETNLTELYRSSRPPTSSAP
jgi:hypothetical protein